MVVLVVVLLMLFDAEVFFNSFLLPHSFVLFSLELRFCFSDEVR